MKPATTLALILASRRGLLAEEIRRLRNASMLGACLGRGSCGAGGGTRPPSVGDAAVSMNPDHRLRQHALQVLWVEECLTRYHALVRHDESVRIPLIPAQGCAEPGELGGRRPEPGRMKVLLVIRHGSLVPPVLVLR